MSSVIMTSKNQAISILVVILAVAASQSFAQANDIETLFRDLEGTAAGTPDTFDRADPVFKQLVQSSRENVVAALPPIIQATSNPHLSIRRIAAMALYEITTRPDGQALLSSATPTFTALLVDPDMPIRRISVLAVATLRPNASAPIVPFLVTYLARQDAVSTIGAAVATVLMEAAPNNADSTNAVVQYMRRKDQTSVTRNDLLNAITFVAKSHNREIGKEVASYADDPDEQTSVLAIGTLQHMGTSNILKNQESLSRIAADTRRAPSVRAAAAKALRPFP